MSTRDDNTHLRTVLRANATEPVSTDDDSGLPSLRDGEYQPFARPANKPLYAIHFVAASGEVRTFQYVHLDSDARYEAERITLRFLGMEPMQVVISGRNLWKLYDYLHQHRCAWIISAHSDLAKNGQPIVTGVTFTVVKEPH